MGLVRSFRQLFTDRDMEGLEGWLQWAAELEIAGLNSFVNGLRQDLDAMLAAILLDMTSGAVEGSVSKLKVFKRVTYGRRSFELLRGKLLLYADPKARRQPRAKAVRVIQYITRSNCPQLYYYLLTSMRNRLSV